MKSSIVRTYLVRFTVIGVLALAALSVATVVASRDLTKDEALEDARARSAVIAGEIAAPLLNRAVRRGDVMATQEFEAALRARLDDRALTHIKIWDADGRVVWSDETGLVGSTFALSKEVRALFGTNGDVVRISGSEGAEHLYDGDAPLLEVYVGSRDADGVPFVFETYTSSQRMDTVRRTILRELLPAALGVMLLSGIGVLLLANALARRTERIQVQRSEILDRSMSSWHVERRRLAHDLHDGVIQDMSAMSYVLPSVLERLPRDAATADLRAAVARMSEVLRRDLVALRSMVTDLFPSELTEERLERAISEFAPRLLEAGVTMELRVPPDLDLEPDLAGLAYRVVREALRNVERHARATRVVVDVQQDDALLTITVTDDGGGLGTVDAEESHAGLRLLADLLRDLGGELDVRDGDTGGVVLEARIPTDPR